MSVLRKMFRATKETLAICDQGVELTVQAMVVFGPSSSTLTLAFLLILGSSFSVPTLIAYLFACLGLFHRAVGTLNLNLKV
jgi:hypothetical protein